MLRHLSAKRGTFFLGGGDWNMLCSTLQSLAGSSSSDGAVSVSAALIAFFLLLCTGQFSSSDADQCSLVAALFSSFSLLPPLNHWGCGSIRSLQFEVADSCHAALNCVFPFVGWNFIDRPVTFTANMTIACTDSNGFK